MPTTFQIKQISADTWVPDHPELADEGRFTQSWDFQISESQIRECLFIAISQRHPGEYTLEYDLKELQKRTFAKIDARSDALIANGFTFQDVLFSCSVEAQARYNAMMLLADELAPLDINSLDDTAKIRLETGNDVRAFCLAALNHVKTVVDSGTQVKDTVRAAETVEILLEFKDPR